MSTEGTTASDAAPGSPDDQQALQEEIERTREHLGETVEALVAKVDVKAQAQEKARELTGRLKATAAPANVKAQAQEKARQVTGHLKAKAAQTDVKAQAQEKARHLTGLLKSTAAQGRHRAATAATTISNATPEPVKGAAGSAAATTKRYRVPLATAVGTAVASVLALLLIRRWRGRS
jgi:chromosome segregation ATPase